MVYALYIYNLINCINSILNDETFNGNKTETETIMDNIALIKVEIDADFNQKMSYVNVNKWIRFATVEKALIVYPYGVNTHIFK